MIRFVLPALCLLSPGFGQSKFLPALMVEPITIAAPAEYAELVAKTNLAMRERHEAPLFLRVYVTPSITGSESSGFALSPSASVAGLMAAQEAFATDPALHEIREGMRTRTSSGPASYLKAVRFDGTHTPGWLSNSLVQTADESALLEQVTELSALLDKAGSEPTFINVFRLVAGPGPETHLISINAASSADLASKLDRLLPHPDPLRPPSTALISRTIYRELIP